MVNAAARFDSGHNSVSMLLLPAAAAAAAGKLRCCCKLVLRLLPARLLPAAVAAPTRKAADKPMLCCCCLGTLPHDRSPPAHFPSVALTTVMMSSTVGKHAASRSAA